MNIEELITVFKKVRIEMDENREVIFSMTEAMIVFMPIIPSSLWNRFLITCLYLLLYGVNVQQKYYEVKEQYLASPKLEYNTFSRNIDCGNDTCREKSSVGANLSGVNEYHDVIDDNGEVDARDSDDNGEVDACDSDDNREVDDSDEEEVKKNQ